MWTSTEAGWCGLCDMDTEEGKCLEHEQVGCGGCKQGKGGGKQGCQRAPTSGIALQVRRGSPRAECVASKSRDPGAVERVALTPAMSRPTPMHNSPSVAAGPTAAGSAAASAAPDSMREALATLTRFSAELSHVLDEGRRRRPSGSSRRQATASPAHALGSAHLPVFARNVSVSSLSLSEAAASRRSSVSDRSAPAPVGSTFMPYYPSPPASLRSTHTGTLRPRRPTSPGPRAPNSTPLPLHPKNPSHEPTPLPTSPVTTTITPALRQPKSTPVLNVTGTRNSEGNHSEHGAPRRSSSQPVPSVAAAAAADPVSAAAAAGASTSIVVLPASPPYSPGRRSEGRRRRRDAYRSIVARQLAKPPPSFVSTEPAASLFDVDDHIITHDDHLWAQPALEAARDQHARVVHQPASVLGALPSGLSPSKPTVTARGALKLPSPYASATPHNANAQTMLPSSLYGSTTPLRPMDEHPYHQFASTKDGTPNFSSDGLPHPISKHHAPLTSGTHLPGSITEGFFEGSAFRHSAEPGGSATNVDPRTTGTRPTAMYPSREPTPVSARRPPKVPKPPRHPVIGGAGELQTVVPELAPSPVRLPTMDKLSNTVSGTQTQPRQGLRRISSRGRRSRSSRTSFRFNLGDRRDARDSHESTPRGSAERQPAPSPPRSPRMRRLPLRAATLAPSRTSLGARFRRDRRSARADDAVHAAASSASGVSASISSRPAPIQHADDAISTATGSRFVGGDEAHLKQQSYCKTGSVPGLRRTRFMRLLGTSLECYTRDLKRLVWTTDVQRSFVKVSESSRRVQVFTVTARRPIVFYLASADMVAGWSRALSRASISSLPRKYTSQKTHKELQREGIYI